MECPVCRLECPSESSRCDCGYDFKSGRSVVVYNRPRSGPGLALSIANTVLLAIAVLLLGAHLGYAPTKAKQWEYTIVAPDDGVFEIRMNELGQAGWEIVSARRATSRDAEGAAYEVILKRERR